MPGKGRLEDFYFLDKKGKEFLIENLDMEEHKIKSPKGKATLFVRDYFHRLETINFFLYLDRFLIQNNSNLIYSYHHPEVRQFCAFDPYMKAFHTEQDPSPYTRHCLL